LAVVYVCVYDGAGVCRGAGHVSGGDADWVSGEQVNGEWDVCNLAGHCGDRDCGGGLRLSALARVAGR
jgi:hypothetical protein